MTKWGTISESLDVVVNAYVQQRVRMYNKANPYYQVVAGDLHRMSHGDGLEIVLGGNETARAASFYSILASGWRRYVTIRLSGESIMAARKNPGALLDLVEHELKGALRLLYNDLGAMVPLIPLREKENPTPGLPEWGEVAP